MSTYLSSAEHEHGSPAGLRTRGDEEIGKGDEGIGRQGHGKPSHSSPFPISLSPAFSPFRVFAFSICLLTFVASPGVRAQEPSDHQAPSLPARRSEHSSGYRRVMAMPRKPVQLHVPRVGREVERRQLKNGMILYLMEDHALPLVRISAAIRAGTQFVPRDQDVAMS